ncbi:hypothetical protein NUU61_003321 [Penicillium alfredii]|uniref:Ribosomal protein S15 n=1 Tax=Penicillium alfredii TaxID=1506179 RepID=A0A9W9KGS8_9EURO|nr:uncharacterized protein NUU61_003321 [Penicillium alfredii]KAJ5105974.1 hypothetical protein NUU61_003321 [Penicillium alfredii]
MPPRISVQPSLKAFTGSSHGHNPLAALSNAAQTSVRAASSKPQSRRRYDPFLIAQARQRKAANISRQKTLAAEREASIGDPLESKPTPFIQDIVSLQTQQILPDAATEFNHYLTSDDFLRALEYSKELTEPLKNPDRDTADPRQEEEADELHSKQHQNAREAIRRIIHLNNGNNKDRVRLNIQKCIEKLGRHNTDPILAAKPASVTHPNAPVYPKKAQRIGPDTGSPEVQASILTVKILNLTRHLETTNKDMHNKRNLQLLIHKRQKLLKYLRKKERGGPRWQNLMETLGLSDAAWKGEIAL